ncbi:thioredoxin-related protein [Pedobacter sp. W3I1]|uniref:TlpA family protein disulfide reductase n=1 Tax=Pedobacter sp. W3I1 TaxID=3042291 RepID=UPI002783043A|nr:TlpA disulfide reductase family protein [Pedobacter sp. W3I1]MDQ0640221.1 thioredoxin-related protein [Pedobacter sp. W3I1]
MKKLTSSLILTFAFICIFTSLLNAQESRPGFHISGLIRDIPDSTYVELIDIESQSCIAKAHTKSGRFDLHGEVEAPTPSWLVIGEEYAIIQVENLKMDFSSPATNMRLESKTSGGREQRLQTSLDALQRPIELTTISIAKKIKDSVAMSGQRKEELKMQMTKLTHEIQRVYVEFGKSNIDSYMGLDIVYRNRQGIGKKSIKDLYLKLPVALQKTSEGTGLKIFFTERLAEKGFSAPEFDALTYDNKAFKFSALKGKYIYLTFGEAGCAPCRLENRLIGEHFDSLKDKVTFVNFSMDKTRKAWETSTNFDKIRWFNITDIASESGRIKNLYDVQAMPTSFLIDKTGKVIEKFIGFNPDFIKIISQEAK